MPISIIKDYVPMPMGKEPISDFNPNQENGNILKGFWSNEIVPEPENEVLHETILDGDLEYKAYFRNQNCTPEIENDEIKCKHYQCEFVVEFPNGWPNLYKCFRFYQFCKMDHEILYNRHPNEIPNKIPVRNPIEFSNNIRHKYFFVQNVLGVNQSELVLDVPPIRHPITGQLDYSNNNNLFYAEINENEYNPENYFKFFDWPEGGWPRKHEGYPLSEIKKNEDFILYLVGMKRTGEEEVLKSWEWGLDFYYNSLQCPNYKHTPKFPFVTDFPFPGDLLKLPNANCGQLKFQFPNKSLGISAKVVEYPLYLFEEHKDNFKTDVIRNIGLHGFLKIFRAAKYNLCVLAVIKCNL